MDVYAPVVSYIDWRDGHIRAQARDDVMVTKVTVTVLNETGQLLEQGNAELHHGVWWEYQAFHDGMIRVEAWDLAGNVTRQEFYSTRFNTMWKRSTQHEEPNFGSL